MRIYFIVTLCIFLLPAFVHCEECILQDYDGEEAPDFDCPSPGEELISPDLNPPPAIPVREGQAVISEWEGALVPRERLIAIGLKLKAIRRLRWLDRLRLRHEFEIELQYLEEVAEARQALLDAEVRHYRERMNMSENRVNSAEKWYRSIWFGVIIGLLLSGVLVGLSVYLVSILQ